MRERVYAAELRQVVGDAKPERSERGDVAAVRGELRHLFPIDEVAELAGFGLDLKGVGFGGDGLRSG